MAILGPSAGGSRYEGLEGFSELLIAIVCSKFPVSKSYWKKEKQLGSSS